MNTTTGYSPNELVFGNQIKLPSSIQNSNEIRYNYDNYAEEVKNNLKYAQSIAKKKLQERKRVNKTYYDKNTKVLNLKINDLVLVRRKVKNFKFQRPYDGPYRVESILTPVVVRLKIGNKLIKIHKDRLIKAKATYKTLPAEIFK